MCALLSMFMVKDNMNEVDLFYFKSMYIRTKVEDVVLYKVTDNNKTYQKATDCLHGLFICVIITCIIPQSTSQPCDWLIPIL